MKKLVSMITFFAIGFIALLGFNLTKATRQIQVRPCDDPESF